MTAFELLKDALSLREFEPESWRDYALIPWWLVRWLVAWLWTQAWGWGWYWIHKRDKWARAWAFSWGRRESPEPVFCPRCLWAGPRRWLNHEYRDDGSGVDVEPVDECPRCGNEV